MPLDRPLDSNVDAEYPSPANRESVSFVHEVFFLLLFENLLFFNRAVAFGVLRPVGFASGDSFRASLKSFFCLFRETFERNIVHL